MDVKQRTPLHFALSNAGRKASPGAVRHLLSLDRRLVNSINGGPLPIRVLADFAYTLRNSGTDEEKASVVKCLEYLLNAEPTPTADFFTALQGLPHWLSDKAVVMPSVQMLLNDKISQRFPTMVSMADFGFLVLVIIFYSITVTKSIALRYGDGKEIETRQFIPLYLGAFYFFMREVVQVLSLISLKSFHIWLYDPSNWLNVIFIVLVLFWTSCMQTGAIDDDLRHDVFRTGTAISVIILWLKVLAFLRNMMIDFAVFVGGVFYVLQRLLALTACLVVTLIAFTQMFYTVFQQTPYCTKPVLDQIYDTCTVEWIKDIEPPFCNLWTSFLAVYTMFVGEVDETMFVEKSNISVWLFVIFMFLMVILLANVLIAIVVDSYKVIQDQRAAIVFWTNRLDFVAEMDAIANGPWKRKAKHPLGLGGRDGETPVASTGNLFGKEFWKRLMDLFDDEIDEDMLSLEFWAYIMLRCFTALIIIPFWIFVGVCTLGWLWPPQVREAIFTSAVSKHSSDSAREDELRKTQVALLQKEVNDLRDYLAQELAIDRTQVVQMKSQIDQRKTDIENELKHIKRIVTMLFEQQASMG